MLTNRKLLFLYFFVVGINFVYSQNTEFIYTKNSYLFDSDVIFGEEDIPFSEQCSSRVKKNSKCYSNLNEYTLSHNGHSVIFVTNEDGAAGYAMLEDLKNTKSVSIPESIANEVFISSWTYDILYSNSINKLYSYEPYWKNEWRTSIGETWQECLFPSYFIFQQNELYVYSYNQTERMFLIKKIEASNGYLKLYVTNTNYEDYYKPTKSECFIKYIEPYGDYVFYLKQDGDYLSVYLNNLDNKLIELAKGDVKLSHKYLVSIANNQKINTKSIVYPRHADGSCDYDDVSSVKSVSTPSTNVAKNKTMLVSENLKLRSGEAITSEVLTVMSAGTKVKILELGKAENIDGINSNWVKVEVQSGAKDRDGNTISRGTVGWCYGGYLAETTEANKFESTDTKEISDIKIEEASKQEINIGIVCAIVGAVLLLLLLILIFVVRKKKDNS